MAKEVVYFVQCERFVKIGYTANLSRRLLNLQNGNPFPLRLLREYPADPLLESDFHLYFAKHRVRPPAEWFHFVDEIREFIERPRGWDYRTVLRLHRLEYQYRPEGWVPVPKEELRKRIIRSMRETDTAIRRELRESEEREARKRERAELAARVARESG